MKIAYLFTGQGSQSIGMGKDIAEKFSDAKEIFNLAGQSLGFDVMDLCFNGPQEKLNLTANTQPALLTTSAAILAAINCKANFEVSYVAGHSLGEYSAIYSAGGFDFETAVKLVRKRGQAMQTATPEGVGSMAAIIGLDETQIMELCRNSSENQVLEAANFNSSNQVVISGHSDAIDRAVVSAKQMGAKRAIKLPVSAPFHCSLMKPAAKIMRSHLENATINRLTVPVITNADTALLENDCSEQLRDSLVKQITSPVKWQQTIEYMVDNGTELFVEIGPGRVLTNLLKRVSRKSLAFSVNSLETLDDFLSKYA